MAYGDIGGAVTELIITMKAIGNISRGDAVCLCGPYEASHSGTHHDFVLGQAIGNAHDGEPFPVMVRGICVFDYGEDVNIPDYFGYGITDIGIGFRSQMHPGEVTITKARDNVVGTVLKIDYTKRKIHVLL